MAFSALLGLFVSAVGAGVNYSASRSAAAESARQRRALANFQADELLNERRYDEFNIGSERAYNLKSGTFGFGGNLIGSGTKLGHAIGRMAKGESYIHSYEDYQDQKEWLESQKLKPSEVTQRLNEFSKNLSNYGRRLVRLDESTRINEQRIEEDRRINLGRISTNARLAREELAFHRSETIGRANANFGASGIKLRSFDPVIGKLENQFDRNLNRINLEASRQRFDVRRASDQFLTDLKAGDRQTREDLLRARKVATLRSRDRKVKADRIRKEGLAGASGTRRAQNLAAFGGLLGDAGTILSNLPQPKKQL